jgi:hypothetical protein
MDLSIKPKLEKSKDTDQLAAYLELFRILAGGSPCMEVTPGFKESLKSKEHREFEIERLK